MSKTEKRAFQGRTAFVLCAAGLFAGVVFGACSSSDSSNGDSGDGSSATGGTTGEAGMATNGGSSSGSSGRGGSSATGGSSGQGGTTGTGGGDDGGAGPGVCADSGEACETGPDCCSFSCIDGECSADQCAADGDACTANEECCGGVCTNDVCAPLNDACRTSGNPCDGAGDCCSKYCVDGTCSPAPSYCIQAGDTCRNDFECCGGKCAIGDGATLGVCVLAPASGATGCLSAGEVCSDGAVYDPENPPATCGGECCSRACYPYGPTGVLICQPPSGCHPTGENCREDIDCCGSEGRPDGETSMITCMKEGDNPVGRCDNGNSCTPAGGICRLQEIECNANANCCSGNVLQFNTCKQDNLGIPRCLAAEIDCADPQNYVGEACASSADCCNQPCLPNPDGDPPFVCAGDSCVAAGGVCTTTADCCRGLPCTILPGSTSGICGGVPTEDGGVGGTTGTGGTSSTGGTPSTGGSPTGGTGGTCSAYGQACDAPSDCCNSVPCTNGFCLDEPR
jgi:hypothetical protein